MNQPIPSRFSANISIMFSEFPYIKRPAAAYEAGFRNIESWWPFSTPNPDEEDVEQFVAAVRESGTALTGLNFFAGDMPAGERGVACLPDRQDDLLKSTDVLVHIAEQTGCRYFNLLFGQLDPRWERAEQERTAIGAILEVASRVSAFGGTVLLEPLAEGLNGDYPLTDCAQIVALLEGPLDSAENVRLLFDTFHLGSNDVDIVEAARAHVGWIGHLQLADAPGRGEPGSGNLPIEDAVATLDEAGYAGYVACEYRPTNSTRESLDWICRDAWTEWLGAMKEHDS